jgi:hypothetical protein
MVLESNGHGVQEEQLWCCRVTLMVLESDGYSVVSCTVLLVVCLVHQQAGLHMLEYVSLPCVKLVLE